MLAATVLVALGGSVGHTVFGLVEPLVTGRHVVTVPVLAIGAVARLTCGATGIAVGLGC